MCIFKDPRPKEHTSKESPPSIRSQLMMSYLKAVEHLPYHSWERKMEAHLKHVFVYANLVLIPTNQRALIFYVET
jgi:hypothetical protein